MRPAATEGGRQKGKVYGHTQSLGFIPIFITLNPVVYSPGMHDHAWSCQGQSWNLLAKIIELHIRVSSTARQTGHLPSQKKKLPECPTQSKMNDVKGLPGKA